MTKRVLITGASGYIGSVLVSYLVDRGYDCVAFDTGFFREGLLYDPPEADARMQRRDARDLRDADLEGIDAVVHLAGISNDPMGKLDVAQIYDPTRAYSQAIAEMCKRRGIRFIFASSCSIYGIGGPDLLDESATVRPQTPYSLNKLQIESDLRTLSDASFSPIALRFATVFGLSPRIRFDVVVNMLTGMAASSKRLILNSDGQSWRPNLHILDACEAIRRSIDLEYSDGELLVVNVGSERNNLQVLEIAETIRQAVPGCELSFLSANPELDRDGLIRDRKITRGVDSRTYSVSFARMREIFPGFTADRTVAQGVREMVDRFDAIGFDEAAFKRRDFYRLQQLEYLHGSGRLSDDLRWRSASALASV